MRVTPFMTYEQIVRSLQQRTEEFDRLQEQLASNKKFAKPSDDVIATSRAMDYRLSIGMNDRFQRNVTQMRATFSITDQALTSASDTLATLRHIAIATAGGSLTTEQRATYAGQVSQLRDQLLSIANTKSGSRYIFSGFRTDTPAYDTTTGAYQGDAGVMNVSVDRGVSMPLNMPGSDVFSHTLSAPQSGRLSGGRYVYYTPGAGTTTDVEIRDTDNTTVLATFSYSNYFDIASQISTQLASATPDFLRIEALVQPLTDGGDQILNAQADIGARAQGIEDQDKRLTAATTRIQDALSKTEDADLTETITRITMTDTVLQALREASKKIISQSLMDFLN